MCGVGVCGSVNFISPLEQDGERDNVARWGV